MPPRKTERVTKLAKVLHRSHIAWRKYHWGVTKTEKWTELSENRKESYFFYATRILTALDRVAKGRGK